MVAGRFAGRAALVTGGATGIGLATARRLASEGARVAIIGNVAADNTAALDALHLVHADRPFAVLCDVAHDDEVARTVSTVVQTAGRLDVLVNNAAVMPHRSLVELTPNDWRRTLGVNLLGPAAFIRYAWLHFKSGGAIINVASVHAFRAQANAAAYAASKAALLALTRAAAVEGAARGVRANAVVPGAIDTNMLWSNPAVQSGTEPVDESMLGATSDVAAAIAFLASSDASFINGCALGVDGGRLARL